MDDYEDGTVSELRGGLDVELGALVPGPAPFDAIVTQGRAIRRRRRRAWGGTASAAAIVALATSLLVPGALSGGRPAAPAKPAPMSKSWILVNSAAYDEAHDVMGSGDVQGEAWHLASKPVPSSNTVSGHPVVALEVRLTVGDKTAVGDMQMLSASDSNPLDSFFWLGADPGDPANSAVSVGFGAVTPSVGSIVAHYTNGKSVSYPAADYKGKRYVAVVSLHAQTIDKLTVYGTDGTELGYEDPITAPVASAPQTFAGTWYKPNQVPALAPATVTFTGKMVDSPGTPWTIVVRTGGFGVCEYTVGSEHLGGMGCTPPGSPAASRPLDFDELGDGDPAVITVGLLDPAVTRVVATLKGGQQVQLPFKTIDGKGMCADVLAPGKVPIGLTAYDASGRVFAHMSLEQPR